MVILDHKTLEIDPRQILPGRGYYLCQGETCLASLKSTKGRQKAFGRELGIGPNLNSMINEPPRGVHGQNQGI